MSIAPCMSPAANGLQLAEAAIMKDICMPFWKIQLPLLLSLLTSQGLGCTQQCPTGYSPTISQPG